MAKLTPKKNVGDGKLPNKYFLSIGNYYKFFNKERDIDPEDLDSSFLKCKCIGVYNSYEAAKDKALSIEFGEKVKGIVVNSLCIEDRLSGEVYSKTKVFIKETGKTFEDEYESI